MLCSIGECDSASLAEPFPPADFELEQNVLEGAIELLCQQGGEGVERTRARDAADDVRFALSVERSPSGRVAGFEFKESALQVATAVEKALCRSPLRDAERSVGLIFVSG